MELKFLELELDQKIFMEVEFVRLELHGKFKFHKLKF